MSWDHSAQLGWQCSWCRRCWQTCLGETSFVGQGLRPAPGPSQALRKSDVLNSDDLCVTGLPRLCQLLHPRVSAGGQQIPSWSPAAGSEARLCCMWRMALCTMAKLAMRRDSDHITTNDPLNSLYPGTLGIRAFSQSSGSLRGETRVSNFTAHFH